MINWEKSWISQEKFEYGENRQTFNYLKLTNKSTTIMHSELNLDVLNYKQKYR